MVHISLIFGEIKNSRRETFRLFRTRGIKPFLTIALIILCLTQGGWTEQKAKSAGSIPNVKSGIPTEWSDVLLVEKPEPTISYRTGLVVYEESLTKGQFVGRGWNGSGFISYYDGRIVPTEHAMPEAFVLEIDGQLLANDWEWVGLEKTSSGPAIRHAVITLKHKIRPVTVKVHTKLDGTPVLTRWLEIINTGEKPAALAEVKPWSGVLQKTKRWRSLLEGTQSSLYSLGYFDTSGWGEEGAFHWHDLPQAGFRVDGRYRRDRYRSPFFVLRNNATGEHFIGELAWTGGYSFEFDLNTESSETWAGLTCKAGPDAPAPLRIISPSETVATPEMHLGLVFGGLDAAVQAMHGHLRKSVLLPQSRGRGGWIESGIGPEIEITVDEVYHSIDVAAAVGAEVFFIDASWYAKPNGNWWTTVGDWNVDLERFPQGLKPFRDRIHAKGMLWGLWMDAERIGEKSGVFKQHPEWLATTFLGEKNTGGQLDLTNPAATKWMEEQIARVIQENELEFFRLDYNTHPGRGIRSIRDGYVENGYWRYYEAIYAIYDRLRVRFPKVIFENCAGGGGRTDIGMIQRFDHTDVTDWQIAPRSFLITNGMTLAIPPERIDRLVGGQSGFTTADYDFQYRLLLFLMPKVAFLYPMGSEPNPVLMQRTKKWTDFYKSFVRPFMDTSLIYHHTPEVSGLDPKGWGVLELASEDRTRAICGLFQLAAPCQPEYLLKLRGLDISKRYQVTFDNSGQSAVVDGYMLMTQGLTIRLEGALTSELVIFEAVVK
jgi:alpha-galactosidase